MKHLFLTIILLFGCSVKSEDSSVTDEEIKNYQDYVSLQLIQDLNSKISINTISGFEILDLDSNKKLILKAFNKDKDISLNVFHFDKINKQSYSNKLKNILRDKNIPFEEKNNSIIYRLQDKNINEICFNIFSNENNLYLVCANSKLLSFYDLENSIKRINF